MAWSIPRGNVKNSRRQMRSQNTLEKRLQYIEGLTGGGVSAFTVATITDSYTALATDGYIRATSGMGSGKTITLHATPDFQVIYLRNESANIITLDPAGSVTINGSASINFPNGTFVVVFDGTNYQTVAS